MEFIFDTSGTTGGAKQVVMSEKAMLAQAETDVIDLGITSKSVVNMDRWQIGAYRKLFWARLTGCRLAFYPGEEKISMRDWILAEQITHLNLLATTLRWLCDGIYTFPSVDILEVGGEMVDWDDVRLTRERFPFARFFNRYATTEADVICRKLIRRGQPLGEGRLPVGTPLRGVEVLIVNDDGQSVPRGKMGEIIVNSPYMGSGYYNNPELTKARFRDEYYFTGDFGYWLDNGELMHCGRRAMQNDMRDEFNERDSTWEINRLSALHGGEVK